MKTSTILVLGAVALTLGAFILAFERHTVGTSERVARQGRLLDVFDRTDVRRIEVEHGGEVVVLVRDEADEALRLVRPLETHADEDAVEALLGALDWAVPFRTLEGVGPDDRASFGLNEPHARVELTVGSRAVELVVGDEAPAGEGRYAAVSGRDEQAYVVSADVVEALTHDVDHFRGKTLFPGGFVNLTRAERSGEGGKFVLVAREGAYRLEEPARTTAHQGRVEAMQSALEKLVATRFVEAAALDEAKRAEPRLGLVFDADGETRTLEVFGACPGAEGKALARADAGGLVCVDEASLDALTVPAEDLRELRLATLRDYDVKRLSLRLGERHVEVDLTDDPSFTLEEGEERLAEGPADEAAFTDWLRSMRRTDARKATRLKESERGRYGLDDPRGVLEMVERGPLERKTTLFIGDATVSSLYARRAEDDVLLEFPAEAAELLMPAAYRVRTRLLLDAEPHEVQAIRVEASAREPVTLEPARNPDLTARLATLEAVRIDADRPEGRHALTTPRLAIEVDLAPGHDHGHAHGAAHEADAPASHRLRFGAETGDGVYALFDDDEAVYVMQPALFEAARQGASRGASED